MTKKIKFIIPTSAVYNVSAVFDEIWSLRP